MTLVATVMPGVRLKHANASGIEGDSGDQPHAGSQPHTGGQRGASR